MSRKTRKLIWAVPLLAIFAVAGALAIFAAQPADPAEAHGPPGVVTGVTATADGATKIKISWTAPASGTGGAPTGYRIDVSDDTLVWKTLVADTGNTDTTYTHMDLKPNTEKNYLVFALNSAGAGPSSIDPLYANAMTEGPSPPSAVRNLQARAVGSSKIELSWTAPAMDGHADIELYCIVADNDQFLDEDGDTATPETNDWPEDYDTQAEVAGATACAGDAGVLPATGFTYAAGGLIKVDGKKTTVDFDEAVVESQKWRFRAYAKNSAGTSANASNIARVATADTPDTGKPTDIRIVPADVTFDAGSATDDTATPNIDESISDDSYTYGDNSVNIYWNWPVLDGKAATNVGGFQWQWRLKESDAARWPGWSGTDGALTNLNTVEIQATVDITADDFERQATHTVPTTADPGTGFDEKGDMYQVRVRAVRAVTDAAANTVEGEGSWVESNVITHQGTDSDRQTTIVVDGTTHRTALAPIRVPGPATDLEADEGKALTQINLKWKRGSDATYSSIDVSEDNIRWIRLERNTKWARETYNHRNVKPGKDFHYRVTPGHSTLGFGLPDTDAGYTQRAVVPAPVRSLTVMANGQDMLDLNWPLISEANDGGSPIVGYLIQVANDTDNNSTLNDDVAGFEWESVNTTTVSGATFTDGAAGGSYTYSEDPAMTAGSVRWFRVFAVNGVNATDAPTADDMASAEPKMGKTAAPSKPGAPMGLVAETARDADSDERTELGVDLLWNQGTLAAGDTIKGYVVDRMVNGGEWESILPTGSANTGDDYTRFTDTDEPEAGEMRAYRVAAVASDGQGAWSNTAYYPVMHMADTDHIMASGSIMAQTVVAGMSLAAMDVSGYFTGTDDMTTYTAISSDDAIATASVDGSMVTIMGIVAGPATITVTATDMHGSMAMQEIMVTVTADNMAPTAPTAMLDNQSIPVSKTAMVPSTITDPDGDDLTWTEMSSDDTIASSEVDDMGMVTIAAHAVGSATITVTATDADGSGESFSQTIAVAVTNATPTAEGTIANIDLGTAASSTMDVAGYFRDADDQMLTYMASSSDDMVAMASVAEGTSMLTVTGVAVGSATITVTATDPADASVDQPFTVTVTQGMLGAPTNVDIDIDEEDPGAHNVTVTWTNAVNALSHMVLLFDTSDYSLADIPANPATNQDNGETTFTGLEPGSYQAVVVAYDVGGNIQLTISGVASVGGG